MRSRSEERRIRVRRLFARKKHEKKEWGRKVRDGKTYCPICQQNTKTTKGGLCVKCHEPKVAAETVVH